MKKIICLLAVLAAMNVNGQNTVKTDTVANVKNAGNVIITEAGGSVSVQIQGSGDDRDYAYTYKHKVKPDSKVSVQQDWELNPLFTKSSSKKNGKGKWAVVSGGMYIGFNRAMDDNPEVGVKMGSSVELAWDRVFGLRYRPHKNGPDFLLGVGIGWKNYKISDSFVCFSGDKNLVQLGSYPEGSYPKYSRLKVFSLRVPLSVRQKLDDDFSVSLSAIMNFNTHASIKNCYLVENDIKVEESFNGAPVRDVSFDLMAALNYECLGVFVKYVPQSVFKSGKGPEFKSISIGLGFSL